MHGCRYGRGLQDGAWRSGDGGKGQRSSGGRVAGNRISSSSVHVDGKSLAAELLPTLSMMPHAHQACFSTLQACPAYAQQPLKTLLQQCQLHTCMQAHHAPAGPAQSSWGRSAGSSAWRQQHGLGLPASGALPPCSQTCRAEQQQIPRQAWAPEAQRVSREVALPYGAHRLIMVLTRCWRQSHTSCWRTLQQTAPLNPDSFHPKLCTPPQPLRPQPHTLASLRGVCSTLTARRSPVPQREGWR